jgi:7-carboxy-7-deazaguanine synthase
VPRSSSASPTWHGAQRPGAGQILVSEIFGPTFQGEGPHAGRPAAFIRVGACNLTCEWCDTKYTWDSSNYDLDNELRLMRTEQVCDEVLAIDAPIAVITGGEPALQSRELSRLANLLKTAGRSVHLETSGSVALGSLLPTCDVVAVSPKLRHSGVPERARLRWPVLEEIANSPRSVFKFVVRGPDDLDEVSEIVEALGLPGTRVWVMPVGTARAELLANMALLAAPTVARGWSLTPRLQVLLWENRRGH